MWDASDFCPGTPADSAVDDTGCELMPDSDGDGVPDGSDACPGTLSGIEVDAYGCEVIYDADNDGVVFPWGSYTSRVCELKL